MIGDSKESRFESAVTRLNNKAEQKQRIGAAEDLGILKDHRGFQPLFDALRDATDLIAKDIRNSLAQGLRDATQTAIKKLELVDDDYEVILHATEDPCWAVRQAAIGRISKYGSRATDILIKGLKDENMYVRMFAAQTLKYLDEPRRIPPLIKALGDKEDIVRKDAATSLGAIGDATAVKPLQALLNDPDKYVRQDADFALKNLQKRGVI